MKTHLSISTIILLALLFTFSCKKDVPKVIPAISTSAPTNITSLTAVCGGIISTDGGAPIISRGVCWSVKQYPTTSDIKTSEGSGIGSFTSSIFGLSPITSYYVRAYATNSIGTAYGSQVVFTTLSTLSTTTTIAVTNITTTTAISGGTISADGGAPIISRGVCWNTDPNPTILNSKTTNGTGIGTFTSNITGLTHGTTYYLRAYSTNSIGTSYGVELSFKTIAVILPTISTRPISSLTTATAISGGNITSNGGATIIARGVCWSIFQNPTILNSNTTDGTGTGLFDSNIKELTPGKTYYLRAYATNFVGTSYGNEISFTTLNGIITLTTMTISSNSVSSAISGGNVISDGGSSVTAKGICWNTSTNPTIELSTKTTDGNGTGFFKSELSNLVQGTNYYLRAYATNAVGTTYGNEISFYAGIEIGLRYAGGIIFYIDNSGHHGLVCATSDQSSGIQWDNGTSHTTGANDQYIGSGNSNTTSIIASHGEGSYAAKLCSDLTIGGYNDWYLPSSGELFKMLNEICSSYNNFPQGGATSEYDYWSSSEANSKDAFTIGYYFYVSLGTTSRSKPRSGQFYKNELYRVRAVRSF